MYYKFVDNLIYYNASDKSGVLFFVPFTAKKTRFSSDITGVFLNYFDSSSFLKDDFRISLSCLTPEQFEPLWNTLLAEYIVIEDKRI